jgi:hypothetical protein
MVIMEPCNRIRNDCFRQWKLTGTVLSQSFKLKLKLHLGDIQEPEGATGM